MDFCNLTCDQKACVLINAMMEGAIGSKVIEIEFDDERIKYSAQNMTALKAAIRMLLVQCPDLVDAPVLDAALDKNVYGPALGICFAPSKGCGGKCRVCY